MQKFVLDPPDRIAFMKEKVDPTPQHGRLPNGQKVKIKFQDRQSALVQRLGGDDRKGTPALCPVSANSVESSGEYLLA